MKTKVEKKKNKMESSAKKPITATPAQIRASYRRTVTADFMDAWNARMNELGFRHGTWEELDRMLPTT